MLLGKILFFKWVLVGFCNYHEKIESIKKRISPVKAISTPRTNGIEEKNALATDRRVPIIKQSIAKNVLNEASSLAFALFIFFQYLLNVFVYKLNRIIKKFQALQDGSWSYFLVSF